MLDTPVDGNGGWMNLSHRRSHKGVSRRFGSKRDVAAGAGFEPASVKGGVVAGLAPHRLSASAVAWQNLS
jgi:hypothetical protein